MTPPARVQAAIEILDLVIAAARENGPAADTIVAAWFRTRRFAGSNDRRAVRDLVYRVIRRFGDIPANGRAAMVGLADEDAELAALFDGSTYGPPVIGAEPRATGPVMPGWLADMIPAEEHGALLERAPLDLRVNRLKTTRDALLEELPGAVPIDGLPDGLRLDPPVAIENHLLFRAGHFEPQDAGSHQIVHRFCKKPYQNAIDLCAGAGGKTLALASESLGKARIIAADTDKNRLSRLPPRAERAGAIVEHLLLDGGREAQVLAEYNNSFDLVLVDAPCTGSGTLRRNPEARWRITPNTLSKTLKTQEYILNLAAPLVCQQGVLVYAVCSLIEAEGKSQISAFLDRQKGWSIDEMTTLSPSRDNTDGFFVARLIRSC